MTALRRWWRSIRGGKGDRSVTPHWSHRREDVAAWPDDPEAREALGKYLDLVSAGYVVHPTLGAALMDFRGADLRGLDLFGAYLFNTVLAGVSLSGADLAGATLVGADLQWADLTGAKLIKAEAEKCRTDGAIFRDADLFAVEFYYARLVEGDFRGATMISARLMGADLTGADLRGAILVDARFGLEDAPAVLGGARVFGADVRTARGSVVGPIDVGEEDEPSLVDGEEMIAWFAAEGANVTLAPR